MPQCAGTSKRSKQQCKRNAKPGRAVCKIHGGDTPVGLAAPNFKTGRYSKYLPAGLTERYVAARIDPELLSLRDEIGLVDTRITEVLTSTSDSATPLAAVWGTLEPLIEQRRRLVESEHKRLHVLHSVITAEQLMLLLATITNVIRAHVHDRQALSAISLELKRLMDAHPAGVPTLEG